MSTTDEIKARIDIVELISESGVKLRKSGRNYTGFCPFHANKHTPAFVVWPETGTWRCFGECNEGGDVFKFVMKKDGIDFREALDAAGERAQALSCRPFRPSDPSRRKRTSICASCWRRRACSTPHSCARTQAVLSYLHEKRGLREATIETFGLGYAPQSYDAAPESFHATRLQRTGPARCRPGVRTPIRNAGGEFPVRHLRSLPPSHHDPDPR